MEKQYSPSAKDKKVSKILKEKVAVPIKEEKIEEKKSEGDTKVEEKKIETKEEKKEKKKAEVVRKELAIVNGRSVRISYKYAGEVCRIIKWKTPSQAIERIDEVLKFKKAVPMQRREAAHQKGKRISGGKFPVEVCRVMKDLVKQVEANAIYNGVENPVIVVAKADKASAPSRRGGVRGKRAHVYIEVRDKTKLGGKK